VKGNGGVLYVRERKKKCRRQEEKGRQASYIRKDLGGCFLARRGGSRQFGVPSGKSGTWPTLKRYAAIEEKEGFLMQKE